MTTTEQQPQESEQSAGSQSRVDPELVRQLAQRAADEGVDLAGPGGLLQQMAKQVLETGLEVEMSEHLGYDKHEATGRDGENSRNGTRAKTVTTEVGPVELEVPRDREGSFEPKTVRKRQRRLYGVDEMVRSLAAKGLTTGEISAPLSQVVTSVSLMVEPCEAYTSRPKARWPVMWCWHISSPLAWSMASREARASLS